MFNLEDEIAWWKTVCSALDKPHTSKNTHTGEKQNLFAGTCLLIRNWSAVRHLRLLVVSSRKHQT